jgi:hypothetical protein
MNTEDTSVVAAEAPSEAPIAPAESPRRGGGRDNVHPLAATTHGAHRAELVAPIRERHLEALRERFPTADVTVIGLQATRLAQMELVGVWLDSKGGPIRNRRTGTIFGAADYWSKLASAYERQHERLEAQAAASGNGAAATLQQIEAEYAAGNGGDDGGE